MNHIYLLPRSDGSGPEFFGFGLKSGLSFRVRVYRVSIAKNVSGLNGFGFNKKSAFGFGFRPFGFSGFRVSKKSTFTRQNGMIFSNF